MFKFSNKMKPSLYKYLNIEVKRITTIILNQSINKNITNKYLDDIYRVEKDKDGNIILIDYNTKKVNSLLEELTYEIQKDLLSAENGKINELDISPTFKGENFKKIKKGILCEVPLSSIYSNPLIANFGPIIPVKLSFIGSVNTNVKTSLKKYGINNIYLELNIHIEVDERITLPLTTKKTTVKTNIPLSIKIIQGTIPKYYNTLTTSSEIITIPLKGVPSSNS